MKNRRKKRRQSAPAELHKLLARIEDGATDPSTSVADLLRVCLRLGSAIESEELSAWARSEVNGYRDGMELPDYRRIATVVRADFSGPLGSGIKNAPVPSWVFSEEERSAFEVVELRQPVAEIMDLADAAQRDSQTLQIPFPADVIAVLQRRDPVYERMVIASAWQAISAAALTGVIDVIRTRALDFALQIADELPAVDETGDQPLPAEDKVSQIFHTTVYGASNLALGNSGTVGQQMVVVQPGDLRSLEQALSDLGIPADHIAELERALIADQDSVEQPGPEVQSWLGRTMTRIGTGAINVSNSAAGSLIAGAVLRFLGVA